jgi:MoaA/NifB/PqqE/SkfB family radical SAM enzyme
MPREFLAVKGRCNCACLFCNPERTHLVPPADEHLKELVETVDALAERGGDNSEIVWGQYDYEPTTFEYLPRIMAYARKLGIKRQGLNTNALKTADLRYLAMLQKCGLNELHVSLFGFDEASVDLLCGLPGAFQAKKQTLENCARLKIGVRFRVLLMRANYRRFLDLLRLYESHIEREKRMVIHVIHHNFPASNPYYMPPFSGVLEVISEAAARHPGWRFDVCDVPRCILDHHDPGRPNVRMLGGDPQTYPRLCEGCEKNEGCDGFHEAYLNLYGDEERRSKRVIHYPIELDALPRPQTPASGRG